MARYVDIHPINPQPREITKIAESIREGAVIALPTDSGYSIGCALGNREGLERIRTIRKVNDKHHFTMLCHDFAQLGHFVIVDNADFRLIKSLTPGPYTFILKGTKEVPRITLNAKKHTVGVRIPDHRICQEIVKELGEPLLVSTLILPGNADALVEGWIVNDELGNQLDIVVEGPCGQQNELEDIMNGVRSPQNAPTTVINLVKRHISRTGAGSVEGIIL